MSIKKVTNDSGESRWEVRVYESGRGSRQISKRFEKKSEAEAWLVDFNKRKIERVRNPFSGMTFEGKHFREEAEFWLTDAEVRFSPGHFVKAKAVVKEFLKAHSDLAIERFIPELLTRFQQAELKKGLSPSTVNRKTEVITAILNFSVKQRRIPFNPASGFQKLRKPRVEMSFWSKEDAMSFLSFANQKYPAQADSRWIYVAYLMALNTGLRAGEIWGLRPKDINEKAMSIAVQRQFNRVSQDFTSTKSRKPRVVPCNEVLLRELKTLIASKQIHNEATIFQNEKAQPIDHDNFKNRVFNKDQKSWGGPLIRFHDLRHTAITLLIANGVDLKTVKEIGGHADIATTMNYVHLVSGAIENVARTFSVVPVETDEIRELKLVK